MSLILLGALAYVFTILNHIRSRSWYYNFACPVASFCKPSLVRALIATLLRECLSTKTCVYPPTAAGTSSLADAASFSPIDSNTPTSYVTELLPRCATLRPKSRTSGNDSGEKNSQNDEMTSPIWFASRVSVGASPQWSMRYVLTMASKRW